MKKLPCLMLMAVFMISIISAEIIISSPKSVYSLGDTLSIPIKIKPSSSIYDFFTASISCNGNEREFYREFLILNSNEEKDITPSVVLMKKAINNSIGSCRIKAQLGDESSLSQQFKISDLINLNINISKTEFKPGDEIFIEGRAVRENGQEVNGFAELFLPIIEGNLTTLFTINKGRFLINVSLPRASASGNYMIKVSAYEKDSHDDISNSGIADASIRVLQIPTTLEVMINEKNINPGSNIKLENVLRDQTGKKIETEEEVAITITKDSKKIKETTIPSNKISEIPTETDYLPGDYILTASTSGLSSSMLFAVKEKEDAKFEIVNKVLIVENIGNVPYNKKVQIRIGDEIKDMNLKIPVGGQKKFILTAPDGEYNVEVISDGEAKANEEGVILTGSAIGIKEISTGVIEIVKHPISWIFIFLIIVGMTFTIFDRTRKKLLQNFFAKKYSEPASRIISERLKANQEEEKKEPKKMSELLAEKKRAEQALPKKTLQPYIRKPVVFTKQELKPYAIINKKDSLDNTAEIVVSINGEQQDACFVCLKIKNGRSLIDKKGSGKETIDKIISKAEEKKAVLYNNNDYLFFIFAPANTRTFQNEKSAIHLAQEIAVELKNHNKVFHQKIDFGLSVNVGTIVGKKDNGIFKFMSLGNAIMTSKKIASASNEEVFLSREINEKVMPDIKTERRDINNLIVYTIREIRDNTKAKEFIDRFMNRK